MWYGIMVSIHAPLAECDAVNNSTTPYGEVSIHAPLAECDLILNSTSGQCLGFYPRTPRGVRPLLLAYGWAIKSFYPRTPRGVRQIEILKKNKVNKFLSTHPSRSATFLSPDMWYGIMVSIHAPLAECDLLYGQLRIRYQVSIHAPLAECD